ncbi:MAG: hypothetical protein ACTSUQ_06090 [Candidatus Freyarchaeota archaeon]
MSEYKRSRVWPGRFNRCWLLGMFVQRLLLAKEGVRIPTPEELMKLNPDLNVAEAINLQRKTYGAEVNWEEQTIIVRYKSKRYNITKQIIKIVNECTFGDRIDELSVDTRGFDFNSAAGYAYKHIVSKIMAGLLEPEE